MSASQQMLDSQSRLEVTLAAPEPNSAEMDGAEVALETAALANAEMQPAFGHSPRDAIQMIVERDVFSDDLQPMLDLRFPEEPQAAQLEPEVDNQVAAAVEPMSGIADGDAADIPAHEQGVDEATGGTQPLNGAGYETPSDAGTGAPDITEEPAAASETPESLSQFDAQQLVPLPPIDEPSPEPGLHAAAVDAILEDREHPLDEATLEPDAEEPPAPESDHHDSAAQRIAAEASATAEALDNLKRLLAHKMPVLAPESALQRPPFLHVSSPPELQPIETLRSGPDEQDVLVHQHQTTVDFSAAEAGTNPGRGGFEFRGFLAGFALSWALGAALYVYLIFS